MVIGVDGLYLLRYLALNIASAIRFCKGGVPLVQLHAANVRRLQTFKTKYLKKYNPSTPITM